MPNFKVKYEDSENMKADHVSTVVFNLHQIKRRAFFGTPGTSLHFLPTEVVIQLLYQEDCTQARFWRQI